MGERRKKKFRTFAADLAVYGWCPWGYGSRGNAPLTYTEYCGLAFNRKRAQALAAPEVARGIAIGFGAQPDPIVLDAMSEDEEMIEHLGRTIEAARAVAESERSMRERPVSRYG